MSEEIPADTLDELVERLADDPRLLKALTDRLARRKALREGVSKALQGAPPSSEGAEEPVPAEVLSQGAPAMEVKSKNVQPQQVLDRSVISTALSAWLSTNRPEGTTVESDAFSVIIDVNLSHEGTILETNKELTDLIEKNLPGVKVNRAKTRRMPQYVFARLNRSQLMELVKLDLEKVRPGKSTVQDAQRLRLIYRIWPDFPIKAKLHRTGATIKAEAARVAFAAAGQNIVWAVMDSGIDGAHPHFMRHGTLDIAPLEHVSLLDDEDPLVDRCGHGTHVAGVIAGEWAPDDPLPPPPHQPYQLPFKARIAYREGDDVEYRELTGVPRISGIAPRCKLVSYKVLDENGEGEVSNLMAAIADVQERNGYGKLLQIHGVNISIGYPFDPEWFACGQSPVCVEVDRLVRSGVVVVVAAGNTGYGTISSKLLGPVATSLALTINDPGNAELAITVGAAHRDLPHTYGVSYFSSKGPTGDGRLKPDLVAPGERVLSCAAGRKREDMMAKTDAQGHTLEVDYVEDSGTSMAAPHVSGAVAAFLSVQREYIGRPDVVKRVFLQTATDLGRHRDFQGAGMVDVMRAIQSV